MRRPFLTAALLFLSAAAELVAAAPENLRVRETVLGSLAQGARFRLSYGAPIAAFAPDLSRVSVLYDDGQNKEFLICGRDRSKLYDKISWPVFSPDSRRVYATAQTTPHGGASKTTMLIDCKETGDFLGVDSPVFSKDGKAAYFVTAKGQDVRGGGLSFSTTQKALIFEGAQSKWYEHFVSEPVFNPATGRPAFTTSARDGWYVVVDGMETPIRCHTVKFGNPTLVYDASGRRIVFGQRADGRTCLEIDGVVDNTYEHVGLVLTEPSTGGLIHLGTRGGKTYVVSPKGEHGPYDRVYRFTVTDDRPIWTASKSGQPVVGTPAAEFDVPNPAALCVSTRDGANVFCRVPSGALDLTISVNGRVIATYGSGGPRPDRGAIVIDSTGRRIAYPISDDTRAYMVIHDLQTNRTYQSPGYLDVAMQRFAPGDKELLFGAIKATEFVRVSASLP